MRQYRCRISCDDIQATAISVSMLKPLTRLRRIWIMSLHRFTLDDASTTYRSLSHVVNTLLSCLDSSTPPGCRMKLSEELSWYRMAFPLQVHQFYCIRILYYRCSVHLSFAPRIWVLYSSYAKFRHGHLLRPRKYHSFLLTVVYPAKKNT